MEYYQIARSTPGREKTIPDGQTLTGCCLAYITFLLSRENPRANPQRPARVADELTQPPAFGMLFHAALTPEDGRQLLVPRFPPDGDLRTVLIATVSVQINQTFC